MASRAARVLCLTALACCMLFAGGCGADGRAEVAGTVTFDGKPLPEGLVTFRPAAGTAGPEFSGTVVDGKYRVSIRVLPGDYVVDVRAWRKTGRMVKGALGDGPYEEIVVAIPKRYWGEKTELKAHLGPGDNKVDFDLAP